MTIIISGVTHVNLKADSGDIQNWKFWERCLQSIQTFLIDMEILKVSDGLGGQICFTYERDAWDQICSCPFKILKIVSIEKT